MGKLRRHCIVVCLTIVLQGLLLLVLPVRGTSQTVGGTILGTISDQSGAVIPGVIVTIKNMATGITRNASTNDAGLYVARDLLPGTYEVTASITGFVTTVRGNVSLTVGSERVVNIEMKLGQVSETVEVTDAAPALELSSSSLSHLVDGEAIRELPLNGRSWSQLATLQPGVIQSSGGGSTQVGLGAGLSIAGSRPTENNYRLNGISISDYANSAPGSSLGVNLGVDAIREFSVLTSTYSAEYGRASGGVINATTRSGENALHGSASYFHRNSGLDARNFFDVGKLPPFHRHQFGGTLGGPIKKNQTFFFFAYEGIRQSRGRTSKSTVLSEAARAGQLSTGTVTVDPAIQPYLKLFPLPNGQLLGSGDTGEYIWAPTTVSVEDYATGRIDHRFSERDSINGTYYIDTANIDSPSNWGQMFLSSPSSAQSLSLEHVHLFSSQTMNSLRLGFTRSTAAQNVTEKIVEPLLEDLSLGYIPGRAMGQLSVTGLSGHSGGLGAPEDDTFHFNSYQVLDGFYMTRGRYSLKMGISLEMYQDNSKAPVTPNGQYSFTSLPNFLTNRPYQFVSMLPGTDPVHGLRQKIVAGFIQNDIRWLSNLSVNVGLRYEMATEITDDHGRIAGLREMTDAEVTVGLRPFNNNTLRNFAPRVGLAWDPFKNGKISIRSGFGIFDIMPTTNMFRNRIPRTPPFFAQGNAQPLAQGDFPTGGFPKLTPRSLRTIFIEQNPPRAYKMQWNLNVQRDLGNNLVAEIGYVGSRGVHLPKSYQDFDIVMPTRTSAGWVWPLTGGQRFNEYFGRIAGSFWNAESYYNSLQTSLRKRMSHGLQGQVSYTFGKSLDTGSNIFADDEFSASIGNPQPFDTSLYKGRSDFDVAHALVLNFLWDIRTPGSWPSAARWLLGGWQLGGIYTARSGEPFNVLITSDRANSKNSQTGRYLGQRPNFVPGCTNVTNKLPENVNSYLNTACFSYPELGTLGNFGRNVLNGPGRSILDFSMYKNHRVSALGESGKVQFRVELFNALNHTNFNANGYYNIFDSAGRIVSGTGRITSARTAREIQFGLRIVF